MSKKPEPLKQGTSNICTNLPTPLNQRGGLALLEGLDHHLLLRVVVGVTKLVANIRNLYRPAEVVSNPIPPHLDRRSLAIVMVEDLSTRGEDVS